MSCMVDVIAAEPPQRPTVPKDRTRELMRVSAVDDPIESRTTQQDFAIEADFDGSRAILRPHGEVDIATAPAVERQALALLDEGAEQLVLDLGGVSFFDSSGLRLLFRLESAADTRRRTVTIGDCSPAVRRVFDLTGLTSRFVAG